MTLEEKLKEAKILYKDANADQRYVLERLFPELADVDDEKIREALINYFDDANKADENPLQSYGVHTDKVIAWLEKQGDKDKLIQELGEYKVKYTQETLENHINSMNNKDYERLRKTTIDFLKEFVDKGYENAVECIAWLKSNASRRMIEKSEMRKMIKI